MKHYVYQIDNLINGMYYRGKHSAESLDNDYMGSGTLIKAAIEDLGVENFKKTILATFPTSDEAYEYEAQVVTMKEVNDPMCYNLMPGGKGKQKRFTDEELDEHRKEYMREYNQSPKSREAQRKLRQQPEYKEYQREYQHELRQQPEYKEYQREYQHEYRQKPEVKARIQEYRREYNQQKKLEQAAKSR